MTEPLDNDRARLELAVPRGFKKDPVLDNALRLFHEDRAAFNALPMAVKSEVGIYADFAASHDRAVAAGVITGPSAA
jgi:hypothetical protein